MNFPNVSRESMRPRSEPQPAIPAAEPSTEPGDFSSDLTARYCKCGAFIKSRYLNACEACCVESVKARVAEWNELFPRGSMSHDEVGL